MSATSLPPQAAPSTAAKEPPPRRASDEAGPIIRNGLIALGAFVAVFVVGGSLVPLDAAVVGGGQVTVSGNKQSVQHREGGIVSELDVKEGQQVKQGDVLLRIDASELQAQERVLARQTIAARMLESRLQAQLSEHPKFDRPAWMSELDARDLAVAEGTYAAQLKEFGADAGSRSAEISVLQKRLNQVDVSLPGVEAELASTEQQEKIASDQLADQRKLYQNGLVPLPKIRELESSVAQLGGRRKSLLAERDRNRESASELQEQLRQARAHTLDDAAKQLRETQTELLTLDPKLRDIRGQIARAEVKATASGKVVGLTVFTVGGVIAPGQMLMEIVPRDADLVIEATVKPQDARTVALNQKAQVRFTVAHSRRAPRLFGVVTNISADRLVDQHSGKGYFRVEVRLSAEELERARKEMGTGVEIGPGVPAEIVIPTRGRTALGYILDPVRDAFWRGLREE